MMAKVDDDGEKKELWRKRYVADAMPSPTVLTFCRNARKHLVATHGSTTSLQPTENPDCYQPRKPRLSQPAEAWSMKIKTGSILPTYVCPPMYAHL